MAIRWDELGPQKYEDIVSILLSRLYPDAQRIDGKGGDGGRDVQIIDEGNGTIAHAFELKSFTDRMSTSRRRQVASSLRRAAELSPACWTLVVPIDHTPGEADWFHQLGEKYCFPIEWCGKTWLDEKMSAFPDIPRYYLEGAENEVLHLLKMIGHEQAGITDVHDVVGRIRSLTERLDEIDPHYRYEFATGLTAASSLPSGVALSVGLPDMRVDVYPKYRGASKDRPIKVGLGISDGPEFEAIQHSLDFGQRAFIPPHLINSMVVDAPGGLGGSFSGYKIDILPIDIRLDDPVTIALDVFDGDKLESSCQVHLTERTSGLRGSIYAGTDGTGWLETRLTVDVVTRELEANFKLTPQPVLPSALLPLWRWLTALQPTRELKIRWPGVPGMRTEVRASIPFDERLGRVIEAFAYLQDHSGIYWEISPPLDPEEGQEIVAAAALLRGESVDSTWESIDIKLENWKSKVEELLDGQQQAFLMVRDTWLEIEGLRIPIGRVQTHIETARLADPTAVRRAMTSGSLLHLRLVPGDSNSLQRVVLAESQCETSK